MNILIEQFKGFYGKSPAAIAQAPGRLEILGNHTDYNEGFVLSCAVEQVTAFAIAPVAGRICRLKDFRDGSEVSFNLDEIDKPTPKDWSNYVKGVIFELRKKHGIEVGAFDGAILSTVPLSAGMSSSAALEIAACFAFSAVFGIELPKTDWARIGQGVENHYMGVATGLLDQFSSIYGKKDALILSDFRSCEVLRTVSIPHGYVLVVANSMVKHNLVDSEYNVRRRDCESAAAKLHTLDSSVKTLRDVSMVQLENGKNILTHQEYLRAKHVVGEDERVMAGVEYLENGDVEAFGKLLFESHESSKKYFENSTQELDYLVELAKSIPGCIGARLSGGGFGGITIHLVKTGEADAYSVRLSTAFKLQTGVEPEIIKCAIGDGASVKKF
ncbi:MAG: galactokinase [Victivallaceae bacterium]